MSSATILDLQQIIKRFGAVLALNNVSFDLRAGEIHCLVGENGAGKSTLIRILSGAIAPTAGRIVFGKDSYSRMTPALARAIGIETIYQENVICPDMSVMENLYLGIESRNGIFYNRKSMLAETAQLIRDMGANLDPRTLVRNLSVGQQKIVQVLKALVQNVKILILDEPTASFSTNEIEMLLDLIGRVKQQGAGIIFISHHLEEVFRIADRVTVLKDGEVISTHRRDVLTSDLLISEMTGRDPNTFFKKRHHETGEVILKAERVSRGKAVKDVSFVLREGEILGIAGMVGSGRSELMRLIYGADRMSSGSIRIRGKPVVITHPGAAIRNGICLLPEDRKRDAIIHGLSVADNIVLSRINQSGSFFRDIRKEAETSRSYIHRLRIKTPSERNPIDNLSGGNQQKVIIARWLLVNSEIIIFDEPTRGIDIGAKEEIYRIMNQLVEQGKSIIMISSELPELIAMSDRILIMKNGALVGEVTGADMNEKRILEYSIGKATA